MCALQYLEHTYYKIIFVYLKFTFTEHSIFLFPKPCHLTLIPFVISFFFFWEHLKECVRKLMWLGCSLYLVCKPFAYFLFQHIYCSIIALQCCVSLCCITKWINYTYTYIPISPPSCVSLPPSLSHPSRWPQSTELISLCMRLLPHSYLFYICKCIYVNASLSRRPSLPFPLPMSWSPFSTSASLFLSCP